MITRKVNGETIELSPQEETELNAEWAASELPDAIVSKVSAVKKEALKRIKTREPAIADFEYIKFIREFWLSITPAARSPTADFQYIIDVYQAGANAAIIIKAITDPAAVDAYNVTTGPAWPAP